MIKVTLNGEQRELAPVNNLLELLQSINDLPESYAVAVNAAFIPKPAYASTAITDGDSIELLVPMQGG